MQITLDRAYAMRENWSLNATGTFHEGVHLVSGDVGSGKSTMAMMLAGFYSLSGGSIRRKGINSSVLSPQFPEHLVTGVTISGECASWGIIPDKILEETGLETKKDESPFTLSRGELKRLHLACILAKDYDLLMVDEPFSSLDCQEKAKFCERIGNRTHGITIIFTHEQNILPRVDRIWEIVDGTLIDCGNPPDAFLNWRHLPPIIKRLTDLGSRPDNISFNDLREAECRIHG